MGQYERFEQLAHARADRIIAAYDNGTFLIPTPYDTFEGTITLLETMMAENPSDRLRELFESITIVYINAVREIRELRENAE